MLEAERFEIGDCDSERHSLATLLLRNVLVTTTTFIYQVSVIADLEIKLSQSRLADQEFPRSSSHLETSNLA